jgi:hypothetical protein
VAIAPIQGVQTTLVTIPVTPIRPVAPALRTDVEIAQAKGPPAPPPTPDEVRARAVTEAVQTAAPRQSALAPLFADLGQAIARKGLPQPVQAAAAQVLAQATPLSPALTGAAIARAFVQSGLFLEHSLATRPNASPAGRDLKADLLALRGALSAWLGEAPARTAQGAPPPPPFRGGPTTAQPPAAPALPADASPAAAGMRLAAEAEGALARHELLQAASLPSSAAEPGQAARWMFEIPFTTPQGASVAQFEISRDEEDAASRSGARPRTYRARFSIDIDPLGPVHAQVALAGAQAGVTLWAERASSVDILRRAQASLKQALSQAAVEAEISVYPGSPPGHAPGAGRFVDQTT